MDLRIWGGKLGEEGPNQANQVGALRVTIASVMRQGLKDRTLMFVKRQEVAQWENLMRALRTSVVCGYCEGCKYPRAGCGRCRACNSKRMRCLATVCTITLGHSGGEAVKKYWRTVEMYYGPPVEPAKEGVQMAMQRFFQAVRGQVECKDCAGCLLATCATCTACRAAGTLRCIGGICESALNQAQRDALDNVWREEVL